MNTNYDVDFELPEVESSGLRIHRPVLEECLACSS